MSVESFIPGATAVGIAYKDGTILGAEKRIAYGRFLISKTGKKLFRINSTSGAACAGMIADMQVLMRELTAYVKLREFELRRPLPPKSVTKLMSVIMFERRYYPLLAQVVVGGQADKPLVYVLDPLGSIIPDEYASVGTGAEIAIGILESEYTPDMSEAKAKDLAVKAIKAACQRDLASGNGIDLLISSRNEMKEESLVI
ncbi:MAG: proteasome subunit beta [Nitrososphaerales archaeon]